MSVHIIVLVNQLFLQENIVFYVLDIVVIVVLVNCFPFDLLSKLFYQHLYLLYSAILHSVFTKLVFEKIILLSKKYSPHICIGNEVDNCITIAYVLCACVFVVDNSREFLVFSQAKHYHGVFCHGNSCSSFGNSSKIFGKCA